MSTPHDEIYIDVPHLVSRQRKVGDAVVTGLMWILYSYLWAPLISLIAWLLGFEFAYNVMIRLGGLNTLPALMVWYVGMIVSIVLAVTLWSGINRLRFSGSDRRKAVAPVTEDEIADFFDLEPSSLLAMKESKICRVTLDDNAVIERVTMEDTSSDDAGPGSDRKRVHDRTR